MINDDGGVFVERRGRQAGARGREAGPQDISPSCAAWLGAPEEFGARRPYADLTATDGSRVHVISPPLVKGADGHGAQAGRTGARRLQQLVDGGTLSANCAGFLDLLRPAEDEHPRVGGPARERRRCSPRSRRA